MANSGIAAYKLLTRDDPVSVLQSMEVVHELLHGDFKCLKKTSVLKKPVRNLRDNTKIIRQSFNKAKVHIGIIAGMQVPDTQ